MKNIYDHLIESFGVWDWFNEIHQISRNDDGRVIQLKSDIDTFELHADDDLTHFALYGKDGREVYSGHDWSRLSMNFFDNFRDDWI